MRPIGQIVFLLFLLTGCSRDALVPCMGDGPPGELCREYRFFNGDATGFVASVRPNDSVRVSEFYDTHSQLQRTITERFVEGRLLSVAERARHGATRVRTLHYNELDSVSLIVFGANDSSIAITYTDGKRSKETRWVAGKLMSRNEYRYYEDDGLLYRISTVDMNDSLLYYRQFSYFNSASGRQLRVSYYSGTHQLLGNRVFLFASAGPLISSEFRSADATLIERKEYTYDITGKLTEMRTLHQGNTVRSVFLYY